ncbi:probable polygalacturonase At3g15720 [Abrus precatorius]|uniref:Probable polygalacturonase At3g15720 n=1 Tax=Abrus precatorius TaxID=3816 RepID=A0A8B8JNU2_ABRPR|nr:probable polygalacturonase At3g15720 [Abrus precatorius]
MEWFSIGPARLGCALKTALGLKICDLLVIGLLIFSIVSCNSWVGHSQNVINVLQFGAKGDGVTDDTQAFVKAWKAACGETNGSARLVVPPMHTFFVSQTRFKGPCRSDKIDIMIGGQLIAPTRKEWGTCSKRWLHFYGVRGLTLRGSGVINGRGKDWWGNLNATSGCRGNPTALLFERCDGLQISGLTHMNGPSSHIYVVHSQDVTISNVHIYSPLGSHNTDGIDVSNSVRVNILDSVIGTGDDCIAIKGGTEFINVNRVTCGPGHGISVGSLGGGGEREYSQHVNVSNCIFNGADSAARIKTWPGGQGYVNDVTYHNISVNQIYNPILIDQHYMRTPEKKQALKVSNVTFSTIYGTSSSENAVVLDCAAIGCDNINLNQINITSVDPKKPASATCNYVHGTATDIISPVLTCLNH